MYALEGEHALEVSQPELFMQKKWSFHAGRVLCPMECSSQIVHHCS
jgi:hypothetical protein